MKRPNLEQRIINRFMAKVTLTPTGSLTDCWCWTSAYTNATPYFYLAGQMRTAHSVSYDLFRLGFGADQLPGRAYRLCLHRPCVNPLHLELRLVHPHHDQFTAQLEAQLAWQRKPLNQPLTDTDTIQRLGMNYDRGSNLDQLESAFERSRPVIIQTLQELNREVWGNEDMGPLHTNSFPAGESPLPLIPKPLAIPQPPVSTPAWLE